MGYKLVISCVLGMHGIYYPRTQALVLSPPLKGPGYEARHLLTSILQS